MPGHETYELGASLFRYGRPYFLLTLLFVTTLILVFSHNESVPGVRGEHTPAGMSPERRRALRDKAKEMFDHGYSSYMKHAFPLDELNPLTCTGRTKDPDPTNFNLNDVLGNFSLTLVDSLDAHAIMNDKAAFEQAVRLVIDTVSFNQDSRVQVFEVTIRLLGALLSAHILASEEKWGFHLDWYAGELLEKATDLADRLMKAFDTPTGIPWPRVNLKTGVPPDETSSTCTAGAGTLILEFGVLSRLTERPEYEEAAKRALEALWARRSPLGLVGNTLDALTGQWQDTMAGVGAGSDSYYEYLFKAYVLFNEPEYLVTFEQAYFALRRNLLKDDNSLVFWNVDMNSGKIVAPWIDSLGAFLPGMQAFIGDMDTAIRIHQVYVTIWNRYRSLPERYDLNSKAPAIKTYPLRPELIESTYMLYQATKDPYYLYVGEQMLHDIDALTRTPCGFAALSNVEMGYKEDRMESFFLSETLKYLYLLFDEEDNFVHRIDGNQVLTTEGHFLSLPFSKQRPSMSSTASKEKQTTSTTPTPPKSTNPSSRKESDPRPAEPIAQKGHPPRTCPVYKILENRLSPDPWLRPDYLPPLWYADRVAIWELVGVL